MNQEYIDVIAKLPCLNVVMTKLLALDSDDIHYFDNVYDLAHEDPSFAVRIMHLANAADKAPVSPVKTLRQAIPRIGVKHIQSIISTYALADAFQCQNKSDSDLWIHSVMVAVIAKTFAPYVHEFILDEEEAYLCGLLHDIGRFIFFSELADAPKLIDEFNWVNGEQLLMSEQTVCGMEHATLGGYACEKWHLPEFIVNVVSQHHSYRYTEDKQTDKKLTTMLRLIQISDGLSMLLMHKPELLSLSDEALDDVLTARCQHPNWDTTPVSVDVLGSHLDQILQETKNILLGIDKIDETLIRYYPNLFQMTEVNEEENTSTSEA